MGSLSNPAGFPSHGWSIFTYAVPTVRSGAGMRGAEGCWQAAGDSRPTALLPKLNSSWSNVQFTGRAALFAALRGHKKHERKGIGVKSWRDYDIDFESRIARYRKTARLLRSAAETMSADRHGDLFAIAGLGPRWLIRGRRPPGL